MNAWKRTARALVLLGVGILLHAWVLGSPLITSATQKSLVSELRTPIVGPKDADVIIIDYMDYNCPVCKALSPRLRSLRAEDHKTAILYKDWAILGDVSVYAARSALAATWQGKYLAAHDALMAQPEFADDHRVDVVLRGAGIDLSRLARDRLDHAKEIDALLERNNREARSLGFQGTPGLLVGRQVSQGTEDLAGLKRLVEQARRAR